MRAIRVLLACASVLVAGLAQAAPAQRHLTMDDLFQLSSLSHTAISPDGEWIAAVVQRPALPGEVYGRSFYEMDPTRSDVWLISRSTGEKRNLTQGAKNAAGFWCATWSPDGRRLAMLSTQPAGSEPRGGDNIRLYVWERNGSSVKRLSSRAMMTHTMGGSPLYKVELRGGGNKQPGFARCSSNENAPFVWLDNTSLLAAMLPEGSVSGLIDAYSRPSKHAGETLRKLRAGVETTVTAVDSGVPAPSLYTASLQKIDVARAHTQEIASVPIYPLEGSLLVTISPDGKALAVLAGTRAIPHVGGERLASPIDAWAVDKQLGFAALAPGASVRWLDKMPDDGRYILDMLGWSPDGAAVAVRGRPAAAQQSQSMFVVSAGDLGVVRVSPESLSVSAASVTDSADNSAFWTDEGRLVVRAVPAGKEISPMEWRRQAGGAPRIDWWLIGPNLSAVNLTADIPKPPASWKASPVKGQRIGVSEKALWSLDVDARKAIKLESPPLPEGAEIIWSASAEWIVAGKAVDGARPLARVVSKDGVIAVTSLKPPGVNAQFQRYEPRHSLMLFDDEAPTGTDLWATNPHGGEARKLLALNQHYAGIKFGERRLIEYRGIEGDALKAGVVLPPDYQPGRKYPTMVWVYAGSMVRDLAYDYFDIYKPAIYNMQVYAAKGYVVLAPSMPLKPDGSGVKNDDYLDLPKGVMPAVDRLIDLGIADPDRLAVFGQSYGGYSTYSLVTYTDRFKAAMALAGITDHVGLYYQFDPTARGYPGIEHQKSVNWVIEEHLQGSMGGPPTDDLWRYLRNSPLYFTDRVKTPLLLIHGEYDIRGPMTQAEEFFYSLYRQGKRARLLRYWGDDHGLRQSPANVRDIVEEMFKWMELNMPEKPAAAAAASE